MSGVPACSSTGTTGSTGVFDEAMEGAGASPGSRVEAGSEVVGCVGGTEDIGEDIIAMRGINREEEEEVEEEPTSAAIIAEEGRGVIVRGDDTPVVRLQVAPGASRPHV